MLKTKLGANILGLLHYVHQGYKIKRHIYIQKSEIEQFVKASYPWNDFIKHLTDLDVTCVQLYILIEFVTFFFSFFMDCSFTV